MTLLRQHWGQHDSSCFPCKLRTLQFTDDSPKTHVHNGDPWDGNPVLERIKELQALDAKETALWEKKQAKEAALRQAAQQPSGPREPTTEGA